MVEIGFSPKPGWPAQLNLPVTWQPDSDMRSGICISRLCTACCIFKKWEANTLLIRSCCIGPQGPIHDTMIVRLNPRAIQTVESSMGDVTHSWVKDELFFERWTGNHLPICPPHFLGEEGPVASLCLHVLRSLAHRAVPWWLHDLGLSLSPSREDVLEGTSALVYYWELKQVEGVRRSISGLTESEESMVRRPCVMSYRVV